MFLDFTGSGKDGKNTYEHDFSVNDGQLLEDGTWQFTKQYTTAGMD